MVGQKKRKTSVGRMNRWIWIALVAYTVVIFLPPVLFNYSYPNNGVDSYWHIKRIEDISKGLVPYSTFYYGDYIVGYPLILLSKIGIPIATSFMWFNFLMLWLVGISCYLLLSTMFTKSVGLLSLPIVLSSPAIMNLYDTGALYNLITVGIVLPLSIISVIEILNGRKRYIPTLVVLINLGIFLHSIGIFSLMALEMQNQANGIQAQVYIPEPKPVLQDILWIAGRPMIVMMLALMAYIIMKWKSIKWTYKLKCAFIILSVLAALFSALALIDITGFPTRFAINLGITITILTMCLAGLVLTLLKNVLLKQVIPLSMIMSGIPILLTYYGVR